MPSWPLISTRGLSQPRLEHMASSTSIVGRLAASEDQGVVDAADCRCVAIDRAHPMRVVCSLLVYACSGSQAVRDHETT